MIVKGNRCLVQQRLKMNPFKANMMRQKGKVFLECDTHRSKLAAGLVKGLDAAPKSSDHVLYLGASAGYTVSFLAQYVDRIFAVEVSPIMCRDLVLLAQQCKNVAPILASARMPKEYASRVCMIDYLFQDVSQRDQVDIFLRNVEMFLRPGGRAVLSIKARSVDATKDPDEIFKNSLEQISAVCTVVGQARLDPFEKDHMLVVVSR